jgi:hypothetical protein
MSKIANGILLWTQLASVTFSSAGKGSRIPTTRQRIIQSEEGISMASTLPALASYSIIPSIFATTPPSARSTT